MESDEGYQPDCEKCKEKYGAVELDIGNELAVEIYHKISNRFIAQNGLQKEILDIYKKEIGDGEQYRKLIDKLILIDETISDYMKDEND